MVGNSSGRKIDLYLDSYACFPLGLIWICTPKVVVESRWLKVQWVGTVGSERSVRLAWGRQDCWTPFGSSLGEHRKWNVNLELLVTFNGTYTTTRLVACGLFGLWVVCGVTVWQCVWMIQAVVQGSLALSPCETVSEIWTWSFTKEQTF